MRGVVLLPLLLVAMACQGAEPIADAGPRIDGPIAPRCGLARLYVSVDDLECGAAPPDAGQPRCRWRLEFGGDAFNAVRWSYSDVVETGTFSCAAGHILGMFPSREIDATFPLGSDRITWDGIVYIQPGLIDAGT